MPRKAFFPSFRDVDSINGNLIEVSFSGTKTGDGGKMTFTWGYWTCWTRFSRKLCWIEWCGGLRDVASLKRFAESYCRNFDLSRLIELQSFEHSEVFHSNWSLVWSKQSVANVHCHYWWITTSFDDNLGAPLDDDNFSLFKILLKFNQQVQILQLFIIKLNLFLSSNRLTEWHCSLNVTPRFIFQL